MPVKPSLFQFQYLWKVCSYFLFLPDLVLEYLYKYFYFFYVVKFVGIKLFIVFSSNMLKIPWARYSNPLQYSCLDNSMNRGAWQAMVHRVTKSWAWLKQLSMYDIDCKLSSFSSYFICFLVHFLKSESGLWVYLLKYST